MEQDELKYLSDQAQEVYMAYQRKFESDDWQQTVEWAKERAASCAARQLAARSWEEVQFAKGARSSFEELINLEAEIENQFKTLAAEAAAKLIAEDEQEHE